MNSTIAPPRARQATGPAGLGEAVGGDALGVLAALPFPVLVVGADDRVDYVNAAAEQFFGHGASVLRDAPLTGVIPVDSPISSLVLQVRATGASIAEYDATLELWNVGQGGRRGTKRLTVQAAPFGESGDAVVLSFQEKSIADGIDRRLLHRDSARSVTALAAMLAHEVKNPLSGIRGAAQLLEQTVGEDDRQFTRLICDESDRICALVDRMAIFSENPTLERAAVNIHEILERARDIAAAGFARHLRFVENYDPSLPPVHGDRDQLIQIFLNLVKNAAEAAPDVGGEIVLTTAFRHGVRLALPGGERRVQLPLWVSVGDNGPGIPAEIAGNLFDPFVTTKTNGSGLGLALVAKLIGDHGGTIEFDSEPGQTSFHVMLPMSDGDRSTPGDGE